MKKRKIAGLLTLSCLCSVMLSVGCTSQQQLYQIKPEEGTVVEKKEPKDDDAVTKKGGFPLEYGKSVPKRFARNDGTEAKEAVSRKEADRIRKFAVESSGTLFPASEGNYLYSPASLYLALQLCGSVTTEGAAPDLMEYLGAADREELLSQGNTLIRALSSEEEGSILKVGNSTWLDQELIPEISPEGCETLNRSASSLGTDVYRADLQSANAQKKINGWITDRTNGLIRTLPIEPDEETAMVLLNTLYFDKHWAREIRDEDVVRAEFYPAGKETAVEIDRIDYAMEDHPFVRTEHAVSSAAQYRDGSYIIFLKPSADQDLETVMTEDLAEVITAYANHSFTEVGADWKVQFGIPLMDYEAKQENLAEVLHDLGITSVFQGGVFSEISPNLSVTQIAQDCRIIVDREGTKAAAVSEIITRALADVPGEPEIIDMKLDHEYGFVIMSEDDIPLFIGAVRDAWTE